MKLENRVEALEHELKILKNEIQVTLLEIQEQILNHYYPELRAEEADRPSRPAVANQNGRDKSRPQARSEASPAGSSQNGANHRALRNLVSTPPFSDFELDDLLDDEDMDALGDGFAGEHEEEFGGLGGGHDFDGLNEGPDNEDELGVSMSPRPQAREVAFHRGPVAAKPRRKGRPAPSVVEQPSMRRTFAALATWVGDSVAAIGKARTLEVIDTYGASGGQLSSENRAAMERLVALADDSDPQEPVSNKAAMEMLVQLDEILGQEN